MLRNQIGSEALAAVIKYLPDQYTKRMIESRVARAAYIQTLLDSPQKPFVWEYFRPGTIELPRGEELYYDEVCSPPLHISLPLTFDIRNVVARSNPSQSFVLF